MAAADEQAGNGLDHPTVAARLLRGPSDHLAAHVETSAFAMEPEANAVVVTAPRASFDDIGDFAVTSLDRIVEVRGLDRDLIADSVRDGPWTALSAARLAEIRDHVDYSFPSELEATMNGDFESGWILHDTWDLKLAIYGTRSHFVALFWATYV